MKTILSYFLLVILTVSCQLKPNENSEKSVTKDMSNGDTEECIADTVKATAIFWIDKAETKHCNGVSVQLKLKFSFMKTERLP